jgi:YD repeat-containing protein
VISDLERDDLHREIHRTQDKLASCFGYDARGRKAWQYATTLPSEKLSKIHTPAVQPALYVEHAYNPIHRRYHSNPASELSRTVDKLRGEISYTYEPNGRLHSSGTGRLVGTEEFRYDPAANRLNFNTRKFDRVRDNRVSTWRNQTYTYDPWGNLVEKTDNRGWLQKLAYDGENRLVEVQTYAQGRLDSVGTYRYDSLGRRVAKGVEIDGHTYM